MSKRFLDAVYQGENHWWLYVSVILAIEIYWWGFSGYVVGISYSILSLFSNNESIKYFIASLIPFVLLFAAVIFAVEKVHYRSFRSLINADTSINTQRLFLGFAVWGLQLFAFLGVDLLAHPQDYVYGFAPNQWFVLLCFALVLIPIQTSAEELLYRGYLMQGLSLITKHPVVLMMLTSLAFAVPHFANPEMERGFVWGALTYFLWGVFFAFITLKDNGLELALGVHAANNLFSFLLVNTPDSVLQTPAIFTFIGSLDARVDFFALLIQAGIFYAVFFGGIARQPKSLGE